MHAGKAAKSQRWSAPQTSGSGLRISVALFEVSNSLWMKYVSRCLVFLSWRSGFLWSVPTIYGLCVCMLARLEAYETEGPPRTSELDSSSRGPRPWWWRAGFFISHFLIINSNHGLFITHRGAIAPLKAGGTFGFPVVLITLQDRGEGVTDDSHDNNARAPVLCPPALRLTENERCFHLFPLSSDWRRLCGLDFIISSSSLSSSILSDANLILIECYSAYTAIYSVPQSSGSVNFLVTKTPHRFTCLNVL